MNLTSRSRDTWRYVVVGGLVLLPMAVLAWLPPIPQDPAYLVFADTRDFFGVPNFLDVVSNVPFLLVGIAGLMTIGQPQFTGRRIGWLVLFAGVSLVSFGSAYFHLNPTDSTLIWDRVPITVGFMGLLAAVAGGFFGDRVGNVLVGPLVLLGIVSVTYWVIFDDLRFYAWVQFFPILVIPFLIGLFKGRWSHQWMLLAAIGLYVLAKVAEIWDAAIFQSMGGFVSGHTIKHLLAAGSCWVVLLMLRRRKPTGDLQHAESMARLAA